MPGKLYAVLLSIILDNVEMWSNNNGGYRLLYKASKRIKQTASDKDC